MTTVAFLGASSLPQLLSAILFYPLAIYFLAWVAPRRNKAIVFPEMVKASSKSIKKGPRPAKAEVLKLEEDDRKARFDKNRRAFVKLIGSAGVTVFLFSIFTRKAEAAFFGSNPGPGIVGIKDSGGNLIDPAIKHPTDGYKINQIDDTDTTYSYYGFQNKNGDWFIMRETTSGVDAGQYRYTKGTNSPGFSDGWDNKEDPGAAGYEDYNYFNDIFN
jgi:hypothetical protein